MTCRELEAAFEAPDGMGLVSLLEITQIWLAIDWRAIDPVDYRREGGRPTSPGRQLDLLQFHSEVPLYELVHTP